jgi:Rrf2 family iron-sulfur cluster assembly transcriptional regulator
VKNQAFNRCEMGSSSMKMSTKGRYAVMAMIDIGQNSSGEPVSLAEIAERQDISQEYLEQLFGKLRRAGLVHSARGPGGGYVLAKPATDIPMSDIILAVDEPLRVTRCEGDAVDGCVKGERCCAHDLWSSLGRQMMYFLGSITLDDVVNRRNLALSASIKQAKDRYVRPNA